MDWFTIVVKIVMISNAKNSIQQNSIAFKFVVHIETVLDRELHPQPTLLLTSVPLNENEYFLLFPCYFDNLEIFGEHHEAHESTLCSVHVLL